VVIIFTDSGIINLFILLTQSLSISYWSDNRQLSPTGFYNGQGSVVCEVQSQPVTPCSSLATCSKKAARIIYCKICLVRFVQIEPNVVEPSSGRLQISFNETFLNKANIWIGHLRNKVLHVGRHQISHFR